MLEPFETWLQSAVAASRSELGAAWQDLYLVSPIWRFWIGGDIFGVACAGALIPSVDKVGRFFPLAILYCADAQSASWRRPSTRSTPGMQAIEERLLTVLHDNAEIEVERLTEGLAVPESDVEPPAPQPAKARRGLVWQSADGRIGRAAFGADGGRLLGHGVGAQLLVDQRRRRQGPGRLCPQRAA